MYHLNSECDWSRADEWVKVNVLEPIKHEYKLFMPRQDIASSILNFCSKDKPEFWAYYADYDWVVLCQLFGRMVDLPKGWPMYCRDIKQWCDMLGDPELPKQLGIEHNAIADARWNKLAWEFLHELEQGGK